MVTVSRRCAAALVALVVSATLVGCDPAVPVPVLAVTGTGSGADAVPGDGVCEVTPGAGDCTLNAAVDEGNALGRATIILSAGTYDTPNLHVTGDLAIVGDVNTVQLANQEVRVAPGGRLSISGVHSAYITGVHFVVEGTLIVDHASLVVIESVWPAIDVRPGGRAVVNDSLMAQVFMFSTPAVRNAGTLVLRHSVVYAFDTDPNALVLVNEGTTTSAASVITGCSGTPPESLGYNASPGGTCAWTGPGDVVDADLGTTIELSSPFHYTLTATSDLVDAIPVGVAGCGTGTDLLGRMRPVDGDGDGVAACDIGAIERPAG